MATVNWLNPGTSGDWSEASNWDSGSVPGAADSVAFGYGASDAIYTVSVSPDLLELDLGNLTFVTDPGIEAAPATLALSGTFLNVAGQIDFGYGGGITGYGTVSAGAVAGAYADFEASGGALVLDNDLTFTTDTTAALLAIDSSVASELVLEGSVYDPWGLTMDSANQTLAIGPSGVLTLDGVLDVSNGATLELDGGGVYGEINLDGAIVRGNGVFGALLGQITTGNSIEASGGTLEIQNAELLQGNSVTIDSGAALQLNGNVNLSASSLDITFADATSELIENTGNLEITGAAFDIGAGTVVLDGAPTGTDLKDSDGVTLEGGDIKGTGGIFMTTAVSGWGKIEATIRGASTTAMITASGGVLELTGSSITRALAIDSSKASTLKLDGTNSLGSLSLTSANQTLEIGAGGALTFTAQENVQNGAIVMDAGGALRVTQLSVVNGDIRGAGDIFASGALTGSGAAIAAAGGQLTLHGDVSGGFSYSVGDQATLEIANASGTPAQPGQATLTFDSGNGVFIDAEQAGFLSIGSVSGFSGNDCIELTSLGVNDTIGVGQNPDQLEISNAASGLSETINFDPSINVAQIGISQAAGMDILTICFLAGTMIRTPLGERAIETLQRGDLVLTSDGHEMPVSWLGRQTVSRRFADPLRAWPIRVRARALGENMPSRDLLVSPDHALLVDDVLAHAGALVNGTSITRETKVPETFVYYHLELDDHSLILAENVPAETFIDNVDRMHFDNWAEHQALHPLGKAMRELPYPRAKARRQLPHSLRAKLDARSEQISPALALTA